MARWRVAPLAVALVLLSPVVSAVQVPVLNVEKLRKDADDDGASGALGAGLTLGGGNVYTLKVDLSGRAFLRLGRHEGLAIASLQFASRSESGAKAARFGDLFEDDARFEDAALGHLRYGFGLPGPWTIEAYTQYQSDEFQLLQRRILAGTGLRARLTDTDSGGVHVGAGYMLELETLQEERVAEDPEATYHRVSSYLAARRALGDAASFTFTGYFQPRIADPGDFRLLAEGALHLGLGGRFKFVLPLRVRYDSDPAEVREEAAAVDAVDFEIQPTLEASF